MKTFWWSKIFSVGRIDPGGSKIPQNSKVSKLDAKVAMTKSWKKGRQRSNGCRKGQG
jgi:hypothetical protein